MFERFTEGAIKVIMLSQEEARKMGHNFVGTEQILLGVLGQRHGIGAMALRRVRIGAKRTRKEIESYIGRGSGFVASEIPFTPRAKRVLEMAIQESKDLGQNFVGTEHLLLALVGEVDGVAMRTIKKMGVDGNRLRGIIYAFIEDTHEDIIRPLSYSERILLYRERYGTPIPTIEEFAENLTQEALDGKLDPVIGRAKEIENVMVSLARRTKNNPVLVGEPGVGKTAVAEGLAQLIVAQQVPDFLEGSVIMALDLGGVLAGTKYRGEFEERIKCIVEEAQDDDAVILVIDEIHTLVGAGAAEGAVDAANILKPALARGKFRCIGATTGEEYRKYIERDPALERRFQPVQVPEPSIGVAIQILNGICGKFEIHHGLIYTRAALEQCVKLAERYIADRYLPDKAIDVMDEAAARVRLENRNLPDTVLKLLKAYQRTIRAKDIAIRKARFDVARQCVDHELNLRIHLKILKKNKKFREKAGIERLDLEKVKQEDVTRVIASWSGIPVTKITGSESEKLLNMEKTLHERIIGQNHAVVAIAKAIRRARVGLRNPNRPIASFIFAGPTGVGKTELTKALSDYMFSSEDSMIRLDMSEYMEKHTVAKLIGSPPGYVGYADGGQLTEAVRSKPYSVVLFDEVEKAHPDVFNLLLQLLDDGRLTDSQGRVINFTNTLIVMTTNLGAKIIQKKAQIEEKKKEPKDKLKLSVSYKGSGISKHNKSDWEPEKDKPKDPELVDDLNTAVSQELKSFFKPEFINRIDEIIIFDHLTKHNIWEISLIMVEQLKKLIREKHITLELEPSIYALLAEEGYDPIYGARPLRRTIMSLLEDKLAERCLSETLYPNTRLIVKRKTLKVLKEEIEKHKFEVKNKTESQTFKFDDLNEETDNESLDPMNNIDPNSLEHNFTNELDEKRPDEEVFTNQLIIEIDTSRVIESAEDDDKLEIPVKEPTISDSAIAKELADIKKQRQIPEKEKEKENANLENSDSEK